MERVTGVGAVFVRARDAAALRAWYAGHLGIDVNPEFGGATFAGQRSLTWAIFASDTPYFGSHHQPYMISYWVADLDAMLSQLRAAGVHVAHGTEETGDGRFGWVTDPEGNRFELCEPRPAGS